MASVTMPQLGESITEGTIAKWLKQPGDQVKKYESLVEVITDKVNAEVPSPLSGTLREIKVPEGATVSVGTEICVIDEVAAPKTPSSRQPAVPSKISPAHVSKISPPPVGEQAFSQRLLRESAGGILEAGREGGTAEHGLGGHAGMIPEPMAGPPRELTLPAPLSPSPLKGEGEGGGAAEHRDGRTRLSPAVRTLLEEHRVSELELGEIHGSGVGGRISKRDVEDYLAKGRQPREEERQPTVPSPPTAEGQGVGAAAKPVGETIALSPMRRAIAVNMAKSKQTIPHAWTVTEVDMTNVVRQRQRLKDSFKEREGIDLTFVPIVIKGVVESLRAHPILNASWAEDRVIRYQDINIGVAVAIDDGLIVPVIRNADRLSIAGIARSVDDLARRARAGKLTLDDVQGATFTVNNPGTFGTVLSYSIIAPPQAAILAMDAIVKRPVIVDGDAIAVRSMMNLCLSFDHRVLDGVSAAGFLQGVRRFLEGFAEQAFS